MGWLLGFGFVSFSAPVWWKKYKNKQLTKMKSIDQSTKANVRRVKLSIPWHLHPKRKMWLYKLSLLIYRYFTVLFFNIDLFLRRLSLPHDYQFNCEHKNANVVLWSCLCVNMNNKLPRWVQLDTTADVQPWKVGTKMDTIFTLDTGLNLDCN